MRRSVCAPGASCVFSEVAKVESLTLTPGDQSPAPDLGTGGHESQHPLRLLGPRGSKKKSRSGLSHQGTSRRAKGMMGTSKIPWLNEDGKKAFSKSP